MAAVMDLSPPRVSVDGKFFRVGQQKFFIKGVTYGPFEPHGPTGETFPPPDQVTRDFALIRTLNANVVRVYYPPPKWLLEAAQVHGLKVLIDIPWNKHLCFLDSFEHQAAAVEAVRRTTLACGRHPALFAISVANEIPADVVRWSSARRVEDFIDDLVLEAKRVDPECLCTFTNFPPTEFLRPRTVDFVTFNVFLHQAAPFRNYLARLQMQSDVKPLVLGEIGIDSLREGEPRQSEILQWQIEAAFRGGLAGACVFSFTDDWWRDGARVEDWQLGLTTRARAPKPAFTGVQKLFALAPHFPRSRSPRVSVIVASYNGARTLRPCLDSLARLNYPDYEVILVDDGSTDDTRSVAVSFPKVRYFRHEKNLGLSIARNTGIAAANGEIVAFLDADCRADEDWLYYLVHDLVESSFAGIGGPNLLPPDDSVVAAAVMASPGGPAHVMLNDRQAEHLPGCNMAFYKWALTEIGGFDPIFQRAGDDVDICWRLLQSGRKLGFSPSGFVWHYRRSTIGAYLRQQHGYGQAEALLVRKHPEYFNLLGGGHWRGRIYTSSKFGVLLQPSIIYRGLFGSAGYQFLYASQPALTLMFCTTLEYYVLLTLPLWVLSATVHYLLPLAVTSVVVPLAVCTAAGAQADLPRNKTRWWSRGLVGLLFLLQPIVRGSARYQQRLSLHPSPIALRHSLDSIALRESSRPLGEIRFWTGPEVARLSLVTEILRRLEQRGWPCKADTGWSPYDVEIYDTRWAKLQLTTVAEAHPRKKQLLRLRLRPRWSLRAKVAFWGLLGLNVLVIGLLREHTRWIWTLLLTLPLFAWFLTGQERNLQSMVTVFLEELAADWKLVKT